MAKLHPHDPHLVPFDGSFRIKDAPTAPNKGPKAAECDARLTAAVDRMAHLQRKLFADDRYAMLLVFQAMDAAGKDGTIRGVLSGVDPAGCQVISFKRPTAEEIDHDFLWRTARALPERGRIGVFNRSYYEEVLVVRVHPEILLRQRIPRIPPDASPKRLQRVWQQRYASITGHEKHLARNGTIILKFWLNVSRDEQRRRLLARMDDPTRHWKFEAGDLAERARWDDYMVAYQDALNATSRPWAPWYAIPADDKHYLRMTVAEHVVAALESLPLRYPEPSDQERLEIKRQRALMEAE